MKPILLSLLGYDLRSAPALAWVAALFATLYLWSRRKDLNLSEEDFWGLIFALMLGVFVGSVGVYAVLYGRGLAANLGRILGGRVPGGSFFGVFWGAAAAAFLYCRWRRLACAPVADALGAAAVLGLVPMRFGCLLNGCCYGRPTAADWGIVFADRASGVPRALLGVPLHPAQLYEAAGAGLIFALLQWGVMPRIRKGMLRPGSAFLLSVVLYALLRFAEDFLRASDPGRVTCAGLSTAQLWALLSFCAAGGFLAAQARAKLKIW
ncbi:MAG: prolipoprotein diacylglyceryl transferase [Elusimicrobia bacterium]|nr:prolipoprotein diacylglyceryl transferase [Elusimicrobiota bacterium]